MAETGGAGGLQRITNLLDEYQANKLFSLELRRDLIGQQEASLDSSQELDGNDHLPESVEQMEVEGKLLSSLDFDLISYQSHLSTVQFNWVEAAAKEKFIISAILEEDGSKSSEDEIQRLKETNLDHENTLKALHRHIDTAENSILQLAEQVQDGYTDAQATYTLSRALTNDIADLELELNELKMSQKEEDVELMTIGEATEAAGALEQQLMAMTTRLAENDAQTPQLKARYAKEAKLVDQLRTERNALDKAEGDRRRTLGGRVKGSSTAKVESAQACLTACAQIYKAVMSILSIDVSGPNPLCPTKMQVKLGLRHPFTGTLVVEFATSPALGTRMISAGYLDQSSQDISPVVHRTIQDNDLVSLILSVIRFLSCLQSSLPEN